MTFAAPQPAVAPAGVAPPLQSGWAAPEQQTAPGWSAPAQYGSLPSQPVPGQWGPPVPLQQPRTGLAAYTALGRDVAGLGRRFCARLIDGVLLFLIVMVFAVLTGITGQAPLTLLLLLVTIAYETAMLGSVGQTLGKMTLGVRVVRADGAPLGMGAAAGRATILQLLGLIPLGVIICAVVMAQHPRKQGWHDQAANSLVIARRW